MATVNRLAEILGAEGDADPVGARRSKAFGILAHPARALQLLDAHQHDPVPADLPAEPEPEPDDEAEAEGRSLTFDGPTGSAGKVGRPKVVLHFHLSDHAVEVGHGLVRPEHGTILTLQQLRDFLADTGCDIQIRPVVDPAATAPVDAYEIPDRLRSAMNFRHVAEVFPYGTATSAHLDLDHTVPYDPGGPPGQTGLHNLGPLSRSHHRAVTFGRWRRHQPIPGTYLFRSPAGYVYLVTNHGTLPLGRDEFAQTIWAAAATPPAGEQAA